MRVNSLPIVRCSQRSWGCTLATVVQADSFKFHVLRGGGITPCSTIKCSLFHWNWVFFDLDFNGSVARFTTLLTCIYILLFGAKTEPLGLLLKHGSVHKIKQIVNCSHKLTFRSTNTDLNVSLVTTAHWIYPRPRKNSMVRQICYEKSKISE